MITLTPLPLSEWSELQSEHKAAVRRDVEDLDKNWPGWREETAALLGEEEDDCAWLERAKLKQLAAESIRSGGLSREAGMLPQVEYEQARWLGSNWMPFYGNARHSPDRRFHIAWGKVGNENYRIAVTYEGSLIAWLLPSLRIDDAWISRTGLFVVKAHLEDDVCFCFAESCGHVFYQWVRPRRSLTFLRFDPDGMGFAYHDESGTHEVRFEV